jgi:hypothetical protein
MVSRTVVVQHQGTVPTASLYFVGGSVGFFDLEVDLTVRVSFPGMCDLPMVTVIAACSDVTLQSSGSKLEWNWR